MLRGLFIFCLSFVIFAVNQNAFAQKSSNALRRENLHRIDTFLIDKVNKSLNDIKTMRADFIFSAGNTTGKRGKILIKKNVGIKLDYPNNDSTSILVTKDKAGFYDNELEEINYLDTDNFPMAFLLKDDLSILDEDNIEVTKIFEEGNEYVVSLASSDGLFDGVINLYFNKDTNIISRWVIYESTGVVIEILLRNIELNKNISDVEFNFADWVKSKVGK